MTLSRTQLCVRHRLNPPMVGKFPGAREYFLRNNRADAPVLSEHTLKETDMSKSVETTDHKEIRNWVEERGGHPAKVKASGEGGILRVDFGKPEEALEEISWDDFFQIFDENKLCFLYQEETSGGKTSRFNKFVSRTKH